MKKYVTIVLLLLMIGSGSLVWLYLNHVSAKSVSELTSHEPEPTRTPAYSLPDEIEIKSEGKSLKLPLADIPQYKNYLLNEKNLQSEIARTQFTTLDVPIPEKVNLLQYSCGNKECSTILVKSSGVKNQSLNLPTGIFQDYKFSPDNTKVLIRYAYDEGGLVRKQIVVAIDLHSFTLIGYSSPKLEEQFMLMPTWPVISYNWKDNNYFTVETAALETNEYNTLEKWFSSDDRTTKKVTIKLDTSKKFNEYPGAE
ncbi:hypothetical protein [Paenibacillus xylanexedens]|uniref:hypothetical protein n=1 Tax=Paenibacillus xylanexedens TaxID=528191 RepID=UPI0011A90535|nr:hypothetical protein [Paenibacillus xylanexedens]